MVHYKAFYSSESIDDALRKIDIPDDKIINIQYEEGSEREDGYDEYDIYTYRDITIIVFYKD